MHHLKCDASKRWNVTKHIKHRNTTYTTSWILGTSPNWWRWLWRTSPANPLPTFPLRCSFPPPMWVCGKAPGLIRPGNAPIRAISVLHQFLPTKVETGLWWNVKQHRNWLMAGKSAKCGKCVQKKHALGAGFWSLADVFTPERKLQCSILSEFSKASPNLSRALLLTRSDFLSHTHC